MAEFLTGSGVALITPFDQKGTIDFPALEKHINRIINGGIDYVVSLGTTGETATLSAQEKKEVLSATIQMVGGRVPVVAGLGGNDTLSLCREMQANDFKGVSAILSVSPYYNKPTQEGIFRHYQLLAKESPLPMLLYNVPGRTGSNIKAETTLRIARECSNVLGIKEASGDFSQCNLLAVHRPAGFLLLSGDDNLTLPLIALGFDGVISVSGQAFPKIFSDMVRAARAGQMQEARELHFRLVEVTDLLFAEGNPAGVKAVLHHVGICENVLRLPLVPVSEGLYRQISRLTDGLAD
jgi:4-hydroxy-tetrahydrodipicolinate synthase